MGLLRNIATVGGYTMASRILGFVRDILIARVLGTGLAADAFFVSQRFPNLFRSLFAEGAFNAAFVPQYARRLEGEGREAARRFAEQVMAVMTTALLIFTVIAQAGMPWLMYLLAGGYADNPTKFALSVLLTQITFPYLLFMSLTALQGGILNSLHRYAHAAAAPILLNVVMILALVLVAPRTGLPAHVLAWAMTVAGVGQFLWMVFACHRAGMALSLPRPRLTPDVRRMFRLMLPGIIGSGVMQINLVIGTQIASWQDSAVSYLYYADRIYQLPLAVVGSAAGVVLLPELSRHLRAGRTDAAMAAMNRGIEFVLLLTVPAAAALIAIPLPIVSVLFERGAFTAVDTRATASMLAALAFGLPAYVMIKVLHPSFFAREDTKTPMIYAGIGMAANVMLALLLFVVLGAVGIAIATTIAGWLQAALLAGTLKERGEFALDQTFRRRLPAILAASLIMGAVVWALVRGLGPWFEPKNGAVVQVAALLLLVGSGLAVYAGTAAALGAFDAKSLLARFGLR